jgi:hypothetical protein
MTNKYTERPASTAFKIYQITVQGELKSDWQDWFNGMLIATEGLCEGNSATTFICKMRDQAELIGIINWLHNMNMVIELVSLVPKSSDMKSKE